MSFIQTSASSHRTVTNTIQNQKVVLNQPRFVNAISSSIYQKKSQPDQNPTTSQRLSPLSEPPRVNPPKKLYTKTRANKDNPHRPRENEKVATLLVTRSITSQTTSRNSPLVMDKGKWVLCCCWCGVASCCCTELGSLSGEREKECSSEGEKEKIMLLGVGAGGRDVCK